MRGLAAMSSGLFAALMVAALTGHLPRRLPRASSPRPPREWLQQAGLPVAAHQFWLASLGAGLVAFLFVWLLTGLWPVALPPALLVTVVPRAYYARVREQRLAEVRAAWPDGLRDLVASISAGMSLHRALENLAHNGPLPLRRAFASFPRLARAMGVVPALRLVKAELADPTTDRVVEVLVMAQERGGAIVPDILRDLAAATARDVWMLEEIRTQAMEHTLNARIVFALPWLVLVALTLRPGPFRDFYSSAPGLVVVAVGAVMSVAGMVMVSRLGREPEEPRVLAGGGGS